MHPEEVAAWIADDPDENTARELRELMAAAYGADEEAARAARQELEDRFAGPLEFGTAGLRGRLGGGPNRMNRAVVIRVSAGLASLLAERLDGAGGAPGRVVVGYDARRGSAQFAADVAAVLTGAGAEVTLMPRPLPTPVLAFAVRHLEADAGVMITASHNPAHDNGYKVYLGGRLTSPHARGALIAAPDDAELTRHIRAVARIADVPRPADGWRVIGEEVVEAYLNRAVGLVPRRATRQLRVAYTPLHGVAGDLALRALRRIGVHDVVVAAEQAEPDPAFPTLPYPNPEEPGALDAVLRLAVRQRADLVIAHDPDGDRCAVAVPDPHSAGGWRRLTGDELGALLGQQAAIPAAMAGRGVLASTIVSSRLLPRIAAAHGLRHATTLTGFKWISRTPGLSFGYEEALGYCVDPAAVRDKDGISAALRVVYLWSQLTDRGETLLDALDDLALTHGLHATDQLALRLPGNGDIAAVMARLRAAGPASLAGSAVVDARDLLDGDGEVPPTDGLVWTTRADDRLVVRPSGTEPKLKCYLEVVLPVANRDALPRARQLARERLARLRAEAAALVAPVPSEFA